jgi:hypothetical protein
MLLMAAGGTLAAAPAPGTLLNATDAVGFPTVRPPRPLPAGYAFAVEDPTTTQVPPWASTPLLLPDGGSVVALAAAQPMCASPRGGLPARRVRAALPARRRPARLVRPADLDL